MAVDIDVRVSGWEDDLERLDRRIDSIDGRTVDVDVDVDDAELDAAIAKVEALDAETVSVDVDEGDLSGLDDVEARIADLEQRSGQFSTTTEETDRTTYAQAFDAAEAARIEERIDAVARDRRVGIDPDLDDADLSAIEARIDEAARDRSSRVSVTRVETRRTRYETTGTSPDAFDATDETAEKTARYRVDLDDTGLAALERRLDAAARDRRVRFITAFDETDLERSDIDEEVDVVDHPQTIRFGADLRDSDLEAIETRLNAIAQDRTVSIDPALDDAELAAIEARLEAATEDRSSRVSVTRQTEYRTVGEPPAPFDAADETAVKTTRYRTDVDADDFDAVEAALDTLARTRTADIDPSLDDTELAAIEARIDETARSRTARITETRRTVYETVGEPPESFDVLDKTAEKTVTYSAAVDQDRRLSAEGTLTTLARSRSVSIDPSLDSAELAAIEERLDAAVRDRSARVSVAETRTTRYRTEVDEADLAAITARLDAIARDRTVDFDTELDAAELQAIDERLDRAAQSRTARVSVTKRTDYETTGEPPVPFDADEETQVRRTHYTQSFDTDAAARIQQRLDEIAEDRTAFIRVREADTSDLSDIEARLDAAAKDRSSRVSVTETRTTRYRTVGDRPLPFDSTDETKTVTFRSAVDDDAADAALETLTRNRDADISPNVAASELAEAEAALNRLARDRTAQINVEHEGVPTVSDGRGAGDGGRGGGTGSGFIEDYLGLTPGEFGGRIRSALPSDEFAERQFVATGPSMGEGRQLGRDPETGDRVLRIEDDVAVRDVNLETREMRVIQTDPDVPASEMDWQIFDAEAAGATMADAFGEDYEKIVADARKQHVADAEGVSDMLRRRASFTLSDTDIDFEEYLNTDRLDVDRGFAPGMRANPDLDTSIGGAGGLGGLLPGRRDRDGSLLAGVVDTAGDMARAIGSASAAMGGLSDASGDVLTSVGGLAKRSKSVLANMEGWHNLLAAMIPMLIAAGTQAAGIAAAFGGFGIAGLALLGGGLLGEGLTLEEATKNAKEDLKQLANDLFDTFQPTFATFAPIQTRIFEQLPDDLLAVSQEMRDLTVYADLLSDSVTGFADWIAQGLDALERYEPMIDQLVRRFGALTGEAIGDAIGWVIEEAYKRQDLLIALAISFQQIGEIIYDLSIALAQFITAFNPLLHVLSIGVRILSGLIGMFGPFIAGIIQAAVAVKAFAAAYSAAMAIAAAATTAALWPILAIIAAIYLLWELIGDAPDLGMGGGLDFGWGDKAGGDDLSGMLGMEASGPMRGDASPMGVGGGPGGMDRKRTPMQQSVTMNVYGQPSEETIQQMKDISRGTARDESSVDDMRSRDSKGYSLAPDDSR